jgi:hypothetical protein
MMDVILPCRRNIWSSGGDLQCLARGWKSAVAVRSRDVYRGRPSKSKDVVARRSKEIEAVVVTAKVIVATGNQGVDHARPAKEVFVTGRPPPTDEDVRMEEVTVAMRQRGIHQNMPDPSVVGAIKIPGNDDIITKRDTPANIFCPQSSFPRFLSSCTSTTPNIKVRLGALVATVILAVLACLSFSYILVRRLYYCLLTNCINQLSINTLSSFFCAFTFSHTSTLILDHCPYSSFQPAPFLQNIVSYFGFF